MCLASWAGVFNAALFHIGPLCSMPRADLSPSRAVHVFHIVLLSLFLLLVRFLTFVPVLVMIAFLVYVRPRALATYEKKLGVNYPFEQGDINWSDDLNKYGPLFDVPWKEATRHPTFIISL
jgi:hypothetical protein